MKKWLSFALVVLVIGMGSAAYAQTEATDTLGVTAILVGDRIFYSGSVDGAEEGIFEMDLKGGGIRKFYPTSDALLAYQDGHLLIYNYVEEQVALIDVAGKVIAQVKLPYYSTGIGAEDAFYIGNLAIDAATGESSEVFPIDGPEEFWMIAPVAVSEGYLYYLDQRQVGENAIESDYCSSLWRISLKDSSVDQLMDTGVKYIGMDDKYVYLERLNFWYFDEELGEEAQTGFETGLYRVSKDGSDVKRLCDTGLLTDSLYVSYDIMKDGILYGIKRDYSDEEGSTQAIVSVSTDGQVLPDIQIEEDSLSAVLDDGFVLARLTFDEDNGNQIDQLIYMDKTGAGKRILNANEPATLFYTEAEPFVVSYGGAIYYLGYNIEVSAEGFFKAELDGSGIQKLANGFIYPDMEDEL